MQYSILVFVFEYPKAARDIWSLQHLLRFKGLTLQETLQLPAKVLCWQTRTEHALFWLLHEQGASSPGLRSSSILQLQAWPCKRKKQPPKTSLPATLFFDSAEPEAHRQLSACYTACMNRAIHILQSSHTHTPTPGALICRDQMAPRVSIVRYGPLPGVRRAWRFQFYPAYKQLGARSSQEKGRDQDFAFSSL